MLNCNYYFDSYLQKELHLANCIGAFRSRLCSVIIIIVISAQRKLTSTLALGCEIFQSIGREQKYFLLSHHVKTCQNFLSFENNALLLSPRIVTFICYLFVQCIRSITEFLQLNRGSLSQVKCQTIKLKHFWHDLDGEKYLGLRA